MDERNLLCFHSQRMSLLVKLESGEFQALNLVEARGLRNLRLFPTMSVAEVDIAMASQCCRHIDMISLPNSGLLIGNFLSFSRYVSGTIDLSGNIGRGFIDSNLSRSKSVFYIHMDSVAWESRDLLWSLNL